MKQPVVVFGCASHGRVVTDILLSKPENYRLLGYIDSQRNTGELVDDIPVIGKQNQLLQLFEQYGTFGGVVAIGDNYLREKVVKDIVEQVEDFEFINAIHTSVVASRTVRMGVGNVIMPGVVINSQTMIGDHCILNTQASIEHNCVLQDYASISSGVTTGGYVVIGKYSAVALGVTIFDRISIGTNTVVGSGSLVTKDVGDNLLVYGVPAKVVRQRTTGEKFLK